MQMIQRISITGGVPTVLLPLSFVILINGLKDLLEDFKRRSFDNSENGRNVFVFNKEKKLFEKKEAKDIKLGDIIKVNIFYIQVNENENFPVDLILISSKKTDLEDLSQLKDEELGMCYIESKNLDGETNMKFKQANIEISKYYKKEEDFDKLTGIIECSPPSELLSDFGAKYYEDSSDLTKFIVIDKQSLLLRGCVLKQTFCVYGIATYLGHNTKIIKNFPTFNYKQATFESRLNSYIYILIIIDIFFCLIASLARTFFYDDIVNLN